MKGVKTGFSGINAHWTEAKLLKTKEDCGLRVALGVNRGWRDGNGAVNRDDNKSKRNDLFPRSRESGETLGHFDLQF